MTAETTPPYKYRAFISYSHRDAEWGTWLHRSLERYRVPRRLVGRTTSQGVVPPRIAPVFRDREELSTASNLSREITTALEQSAALIVVCSPSAAESRWVNEEIRAYQRLGRAEHVFCLIVGGEPGAPGQECFPPALLEPADGGSVPEPIAADVRPGKDGRTGALLKLVAGLVGVGFDDLARREQQRRQKRLATIAVAAVAGMGVTSVLATLALLARNEAERQRERAEVEAATAQQTADFLVNLFQVADPSEARGNSITAREILDRGALRIDRDLADQPRVRAGLLETMGRVYTGLGLFNEATDLLSQSVEVRRQLGRGASDEGVRTANALGLALHSKGDFEAAEPVYVAALAAARELHPGDDPLVVEAMNGVADVQYERAEFATAEAGYREALAMARRLYGDTHADVGRSLAGLARALLFQQRFDESEAAFREALVVRREALGADHPHVAMTLNDLGSVLYFAGRADEAEPYFREAADLWIRILGREHPYVSDIQNNLGRLLLERGELRAAESLLTEALAIDRKLVSRDAIVYPLNNLGLVRLGLGEPDAALPLFEEALAEARTNEHPVMLGEVSANLADVYWRVGRTADARKALESARSAFAALRPDEQTYADNLASIEGAVLVAEGNVAEGERLLLSNYMTISERSGPQSVFTRLAASRLVRLYDTRGDREAAQTYRSIAAAE
jgi:tetratricopeptide (TPR) repeat protein